MMSKLSNCLRMIELLMARGKMKIKELTEELEVEERMIRDYKNELDKAGIFIESERGPNGGYYLDKYTMFPIKNFTATELESLNIAVKSTLAKKNKDNQLLKIALDKINAVQRENEFSSRHFYFASNSLVNNELGNESEIYNKLYQAFHNRQKVEIIYTAASTNETTKRIINPYAFVFYNEFIYCTAFCEVKNGMRNFKVVRIKKAVILSEKYEIPEKFHIRHAFPTLGFVKDPFNIELIIRSPFSYRVRESIFGKNQQIIELNNGNGSIKFRAEVNGKETVKKWILGMGSCAEVIQPEWLRNEIIKDLTVLLKKYTN